MKKTLVLHGYLQKVTWYC